MTTFVEAIKMLVHGRGGEAVSLDIERTHLANERTLLAYVRTCLAVLVAGAAFVHFSDGKVLVEVVGGSFVILAVAGVFIGFSRFGRTQRMTVQAGLEEKSGEGKK